ncbi:MAG TPA: aspartyl protease family protein, partial [Acidimicrobiales bacterium]
MAIGAAVVALAVAALVSGPRQAPHSQVRVEPQVTFALPPASSGCIGATALPGSAAAEKAPLTVSVVAGQVAEAVNVCIGDQGPFPFVLDTGAGQSTIDAGLAHRLHLASAGPPSEFAGVGCTGTARPVSVGDWSLDGVPLSAQQLTAATLPQMGGKGEPVGLLGSDVLSRFGAIRIDFGSGDLILPGAEGAPLAQSSPFTGPLGTVPTALTQGEQGTTVPLTVTPAPGDVSLNVAVRFDGGRRRDFV